MSMYISGNGVYGANIYQDVKKESGQTSKATESQKNSKADVEEYYKKLCKKFPQINFNTKGGVLPSSNSKVTVNLSYDCLKKMANDPEFAKKMEFNLSGEAAANSMVYSWANRDGVELGGRTVVYDANGNRQSSCGGMRTANTGNGDNVKRKFAKKYQSEEDRYLKARKSREEKEKRLKKLAKKRVKKTLKEREKFFDAKA